jgi:hypothetical protein
MQLLVDTIKDKGVVDIEDISEESSRFMICGYFAAR